MNRLRKFIDRPFFIESVIVFGLLVITLSWYANSGLKWLDLSGQRLFCEYLLKGVNPYIQSPIEILKLKGLEPTSPVFGTSPWGCLLGNLFYAGFLPYGKAKVWYLLLCAVAYIIACIYFLCRYPSRKMFILILASLGLISYLFPILAANAGGVICLLLLMALALKDRHDVMAGLCLAFALVKPQASLLLCLYFLLQRNYRILFVAAIAVLSAWLFVSIRLDVGMLELLREMLDRNVGGENHYNGIMTFLAPEYVSLSATLYLSMMVGIIYSVGLYFYILRKYGKDGILPVLPFCVGTQLWCYTYGHEMMILLPVTAFCLSIYGMVDIRQRIILAVSFILTSFGLPVLYVLMKVCGDWVLGYNVYALLCGVMLPLVLMLVVRKQPRRIYLKSQIKRI